MHSIQPIRYEHVTGSTRELLAAMLPGVNTQSNLILTMAHSGCALDAYASLRQAVGKGMLGPRLREQLALAISQAQTCEYGLAVHAELARRLGFTEDEIVMSREARSRDRTVEAALTFARDLVEGGDPPVAELRQSGYEDEAILELITVITLERFANDVALIAQTRIDAPPAARAYSAA